MITSNHVHLLIKDTGPNVIADSMQLIAGRTAQEYNQRKDRQGAFWEDRYHATVIETDEHLHRCLVYIDLNMVSRRRGDSSRRVGARVGIARSRHHPSGNSNRWTKRMPCGRRDVCPVPVYPKDRKGFPLDSHDAREYDSGYAFWLQVSRSWVRGKFKISGSPKRNV